MVTDERRGGAGSLTVRCCPRCRYIRQATDTAPDWQCPACGVAFEKAEAGDSVLRSYTVPRGVYYAKTESGPRWSAWLLVTLFGVAIAAGLNSAYKRPAPEGDTAVAGAAASASAASAPGPGEHR